MVSFLINRIRERGERGASRSYVLNIDAGWGHGKTYFLDRFGRDLAARGYLIASVNAWRNDHADDPLLPVMSAIDDAVAPYLKNEQAAKAWAVVKRTGGAVAVAAIKGAAEHWARKAIGDGVDAVIRELGVGGEVEKGARGAGESASKQVASMIDGRADLMMQGFKEAQRSIQNFRTELEAFLQTIEKNGHVLPLFVLIDELDRCRPSYAISMLERVKHLFDINNVVFVVATDTQQLQHAIGAVYGEGFDSQRYLTRFFDRSYRFQRPSMTAFVESLAAALPIEASKISVPESLTLAQYLAGACQYCGVGLRDAEQIYDIIRSIMTVWTSRAKLELSYLTPIAIAYQQGLNIDTMRAGSVASDLKQLSIKNDGDRTAWQVMVANAGRDREPQYVSGLDFYTAFSNYVATPLHELPNASQVDLTGRWVLHRLRDEFSSVYNNTYDVRSPPHSELPRYSAMVATAGRLLPTAGNS